MKNKKILILGATGQIGKELSLKFKNSKNLNIISHARNLVSSSFFKHNGIVHVIGNLFDDNIVLEISNADLIFDLAAPDHGTLQEIKQFYKKRFDFVFSKMKKNSKFVFASTMNAFGMDNKRNILKNYFFSSSIYASNKRYAEKYIVKIGKENLIKTYSLRLAEVHGNYQRASLEIIKLIKEKYVFRIPNTPAWVTFIPIIKQSIINILNDKEMPGLYTLTCDDVHWHDILQLFGNKINLYPKYIIKKKEGKIINIKNIFYKYIISNKDAFRGNFNLNKNFEDSMKLNFRINKVISKIKKFKGVKVYIEKDRYIGILPGKRLTSLDYNIKNILD